MAPRRLANGHRALPCSSSDVLCFVFCVLCFVFRKKLNTKHQTQNTKHQTPNTKHQTPNTKHQTPNTNYDALVVTSRLPRTISSPASAASLLVTGIEATEHNPTTT